MLNRMLDCFTNAESLAIHAENSRAALRLRRLEIIERLKTVARRHGLEVLACGCKGPDISSGSCHVSGRWPPTAQVGNGAFRHSSQQELCSVDRIQRYGNACCGTH